MNKTGIKNFAIWARNKLIADVGYRAGLMGITEKGIANALPQSTGDTEFYDIGAAEPFSISGEASRQRKKLVEVIRTKGKDTDYKTAYQYIIEEVAYTWFNRLIAVRFMEVNDYLPGHIRVLSSESGKLEPDLVTTPFDADLSFTPAEEAELVALKQDNKLDEAFRLLFIKQCNALNGILPGLFEKTKDYTELLLNLSVIDQEGVVYHLTHDIPEDDFNIERGGQVEIIGWLYQYYNTEPKAAAFAKNGKITKEELPAVTQLFTPDWIVRYMVENSLGRLWLEGHPDSNLKKNWKYYLDEAPQEPEVQVKLAEIRKEYAALTPEDIKLIDPCMGSGHILVYAFDVLMQIYTSVGYSERDAAKSILEHNLYGLDIDDRAYQLAYFAVMMKARQYNRRILNGENTCHVYAIQESNTVNRVHLKYFGAGMSDLAKNTAKTQLEGLLDTLTDAKEYGSILNVENYDWKLLRRFVASVDAGNQISMDSFGMDETAEQLKQLIDIGETMAQKYWVAVTNPPYASMSKMNASLNTFAQKYYTDYKSDLFSAFVVKCSMMTLTDGFCAFLTPYVWMFIQSYEKMRQYLYANTTIETLIQFEYSAFEEATVPICTFAFKKGYVPKKGCYLRLTDFRGGMEVQRKKSLEAINNHACGFYYEQCADNFAKIPGSPVAYWMSKAFIGAYTHKKIGEYGFARSGLQTGNNDLFLKLWQEISVSNIAFNMISKKQYLELGKTWTPQIKGGAYRKWYGNFDYVVNWKNDGEQIKSCDGCRLNAMGNDELFFREGITWSHTTSSIYGARFLPVGFLFNVEAPTLFVEKKNELYVLAYLNSCVAQKYLNAINSTMHYLVGNISALPMIYKPQHAIDGLAQLNIEFCRKDWDSFETSWDFTEHPLVRWSKGLWDATGTAATMDYYYGHFSKASCPLEICYLLWQGECSERFNKLKTNEEELNRIFIDIYGLQDELTPEVEERDVTVRKADLQRDIKSLLSYAVGCMFGRYSLDRPGLVFAGGDFNSVYWRYKGQAALDEDGNPIEGGYAGISLADYHYPKFHDADNWETATSLSYEPDADNVIPITDEEYLEDDIVARLCSWLKVVYGEDTLEANLDFIAKALGNKGNSSREIIRNYFLNDFFKDHCQTYSVTGSGKRPIYWLFDSGKQNGFKALVYLHRYTPDTIGNLRVDYLHKMQRVYESEIERMQDMIDHSANAREVAAATKRKDKLTKQLKECRDYDEKIGHLALSRIELDLDNGVKVNYRKLQTAYDGKFYEVLADSKNIMAKEKK